MGISVVLAIIVRSFRLGSLFPLSISFRVVLLMPVVSSISRKEMFFFCLHCFMCWPSLYIGVPVFFAPTLSSICDTSVIYKYSQVCYNCLYYGTKTFIRVDSMAQLNAYVSKEIILELDAYVARLNSVAGSRASRSSVIAAALRVFLSDCPKNETYSCIQDDKLLAGDGALDASC